MSLLAVDAGNSRIKWGLWERQWLRQESVATGEVARLASTWSVLPLPQRMIAKTFGNLKRRRKRLLHLTIDHEFDCPIKTASAHVADEGEDVQEGT